MVPDIVALIGFVVDGPVEAVDGVSLFELVEVLQPVNVSVIQQIVVTKLIIILFPNDKRVPLDGFFVFNGVCRIDRHFTMIIYNTTTSDFQAYNVVCIDVIDSEELFEFDTMLFVPLSFIGKKNRPLPVGLDGCNQLLVIIKLW